MIGTILEYETIDAAQECIRLRAENTELREASRQKAATLSATLKQRDEFRAEVQELRNPFKNKAPHRSDTTAANLTCREYEELTSDHFDARNRQLAAICAALDYRCDALEISVITDEITRRIAELRAKAAKHEPDVITVNTQFGWVKTNAELEVAEYALREAAEVSKGGGLITALAPRYPRGATFTKDAPVPSLSDPITDPFTLNKRTVSFGACKTMGSVKFSRNDPPESFPAGKALAALQESAREYNKERVKLYGIEVAADKRWAGTMVNAGGGTITPEIIQKGLERARRMSEQPSRAPQMMKPYESGAGLSARYPDATKPDPKPAEDIKTCDMGADWDD